MRTLALNGALSLLALAVSLLAVEGTLWLVRGEDKRVAHLPERPRFYYLPKSSASMRGNLPSHGERFRVAIVGDSFTFGPKMQFDDAFPARLDRMLNLNADGRVARVVSYGSPGASTHHEVRLTRRALKEGADLIVVQVTLNDPQPSPLRSWGHGHSTSHPLRTISWVNDRLALMRSEEEYIRYHHQLFDDPTTWHLFSESLLSIQKITRAHGKPLVVVLFPLFDFPFDRYPFRSIHRKVKEFCVKHGILFDDLLRAYDGVDHVRMQLIPGTDAHPNEIAHRIAAEAIYRRLRREHLIPKEFVIQKTTMERERAH
jgi:hypothetical protein